MLTVPKGVPPSDAILLGLIAGFAVGAAVYVPSQSLVWAGAAFTSTAIGMSVLFIIE